LVTGTHAEAQAVSEDIQALRLRAGTIDTRRAVSGQSGQTIYVGDVVQTRRNDAVADVQNRQNWVVKKVTSEHVVLESAADSSDLRKVTLGYAESYLHLAYATTVYGVQGETTDCSLVGPGVDAAGLYVGLTRGKHHNAVVLIAPTEGSARSQLVETMQRQLIEATLDVSRSAARVELNRAAREIAAECPTVGTVQVPSATIQ
jgi:ATP-dependent exoDNAse (exonuclease V) alpha subunit